MDSLLSESTHKNIRDENLGLLDWQGLRSLSLRPGGFGQRRAEIWSKLLNVTPTTISSQDPTEFQSAPRHADERQIQLDTERSFVLYPVDTHYDDRETLQAELNQLIVSVFRKRPKLSYFQGYHDIITVLYLTLPQELQFPCAEKISLTRVRDSMGTGLEPVLGLLRILRNLLRIVDPSYAAILEQTAPLPFHALSNLLTLFSHDVPTLPLIQHIFDYLLCRHPLASVYFAAAIILLRKPEVERLEHEGEEGMIHSLLSSLPDLYEDNEESEDSCLTHDGSVNAQEIASDGDPILDPRIGLLSPSTSSTLDPSYDPFSPSMASDTVLGTETDEASTVVATSDDEFEKEYHFASPPPTTASLPMSPQAPPILSLGEDSTSSSALHSSIVSESSSELRQPPSGLVGVSLSAEASSQSSVSHMETDSTSAITPQATSPSAPSHSRVEIASDSDTDSDDANDPSSPRYRRPRFCLSALLQKADELCALAPPTDPALGVSNIFGPLSTVHTWSEDFTRQPSDEEAEQIVGQLDKVVLPVVGTSPVADDEKGKENEVTEPTKRRKKRRGASGHVVDNRSVFTSAVVVLGLALAIYSVRTRGSGGIGGATSASSPWNSNEWSRWFVNGLL